MRRRRARMRRIEIKRRGLRIALEKVRKRGLYCLPLIRIVVLFFFKLLFVLYNLNV